MFDIGFSELVLVMIVGLIVLGPQRMPIAIRTVMGWVRTLRNLASNVQNELSQELKLQELKDSIKKAEELNLKSLSPELSKTVEELKQSAQKMKAELDSQGKVATSSIQAEIDKVQRAIDKDLAEVNHSEQNADADNVNSAQKTTEKDTALLNNQPQLAEDDQAELAEQDELLAKYIDQYHPEEGELVPAKPIDNSKKHNL
ncbi:Sec-independent protein translocase protein TatB [Volucribacter amazonae]|uniref:Sec-independent protein translocase protein TatB n=1 Tax=Volucribacter amazonae TaxID=256731 RepID=A0A9X4PQB6_9PAST|nr:Sec-independent protein translocase protein TatB [Volucribacter amazonae]MDG6895658.1 hypothetical protein [Volucribacter amazonae]